MAAPGGRPCREKRERGGWQLNKDARAVRNAYYQTRDQILAYDLCIADVGSGFAVPAVGPVKPHTPEVWKIAAKRPNESHHVCFVAELIRIALFGGRDHDSHWCREKIVLIEHV